jgi:hypothetical protein
LKRDREKGTSLPLLPRALQFSTEGKAMKKLLVSLPEMFYSFRKIGLGEWLKW